LKLPDETEEAAVETTEKMAENATGQDLVSSFLIISK
jgi:hypothetical protein